MFAKSASHMNSDSEQHSVWIAISKLVPVGNHFGSGEDFLLSPWLFSSTHLALLASNKS